MTPLSWRARTVGAVSVAAAGLAPLVAYVGNLGFAPLIATAGGVSAATLATRRRPWPALALLAATALFAAASYGWGAVRPVAFPRYHEVEQLTGLKLLLETALYGSFVLAAGEAPPRAARLALLVAGVGFAAVAALLLVEALGGAALYQGIKRAAHQATRPDLARRNVARGAYALALLLWPLVLRLREGRASSLAGGLLAVGGVAAAVFLRVDAPVVAIVLSTAVLGLVRYGGPRVAQVLGAAAAAGVLAAPWLAGLLPATTGTAAAGVAKASWGARLAIWRFVAARVRERPLGWGLDGSRVFPDAVPLHPHDMALQVWLELGVVGAVAAAAFWALVFLGCARLARRDRSLGAAAAASATAYLVIGGLSFGVWQEWWLALGALAAAIVTWSATARRVSLPGFADLYPAPP